MRAGILLVLSLCVTLSSAGFATAAGGMLRRVPLPWMASTSKPGQERSGGVKTASGGGNRKKKVLKVTRRKSLAAVMMLTGRAWMGTVMLALPRFTVDCSLNFYKWLPNRLPKFWQTPSHWLTKNGLGQSLFLLSNVAYLYAGVMLLMSDAPRILGTSVLAVCAASCAYHAAQILHGTGSAPAAKFCTIDTILAVATALTFTWSVHIEPTNVAFALLSLAFFKDTFGLGYTTSHSLWHFSTAGAAMVSRRRHSNA